MGNLGCKAGYSMIRLRQDRKGSKYGQVILQYVKSKGYHR